MDQLDLLFKENNVFYNVIAFLITENEKLFDRCDAQLYWRTVLHISTIYHHAYVSLFATDLGLKLEKSLDRDVKMLFTFRGAYLTGWNFMFQTTFLFLALAHDVLEWASKEDSNLGRKIRYWRDVIFSGLVVPYTCFVFGMFWTLYAIDRELVFPKAYDGVVPWWFNQCVHTNILALVVLETILQARRKPADKKLELILNAGCGILYAIVYYSIYFFAGRWLYNVFGVMNWWQICIFQIGIWASAYIFYAIQWPINRLFHGKEPEPNEERKEQNGISQIGTPQNGTSQNGEQKNGEVNQTEVKEINEVANGNDKNGVFTTNVDFKAPPFSTKSWSLKYRSIRNQFENSNL